ncbi:MAG: hypothetical protein IIY21_23755, partial [Clostridiales bacterium]|nr:hypothetical protein [Clostridiales bacterium]
RGKRASAGGYHFARFEQNADIERARTRVQEELREKERQKVQTKAERKSRAALIDNVHDLLVDTNRRARNARKEGIYNTDPVLQRMMSHTDYFGANKTGGYLTSKQHLRSFSNEELQNLASMIENEKGEYAKNVYDRMSRHRNIATYALQFGITVNEAEKYFKLYPILFELFNISKQNTEYRSSDPTIVSEIYESMQSGEDPDELLDFILDLKNFYTGSTTEDLDAIISSHAKQRDEWNEWEELE